ncbi:hypothetical protein [Falsigemmobacter intermedius]|uniref:hypothetical protein n=1 Tax=Falsigemmobacter intermedius TaxID=1553448 RepID=UPI003EFC74B8
MSFSLVAAPLQANVLNDMLCYEGATIRDGKDHLRIVIADDGSFEGFPADTEARSFAIGPELIGRAEISAEKIILISQPPGSGLEDQPLVLTIDVETGRLTTPFVPVDAKRVIRCEPFSE